MIEGEGHDSALSVAGSLPISKLPAVGIDLGGTKIRAAAVCGNEIIGEPRQVKTPEGPDNIIEALIELITEFQGEHVVAGVGIATAGIVDCSTGEVVGSTGNIPGWAGTRVKQSLENRTMLPVHVDNDANAAAYAESRIDELKGSRCVVTVTLGTGIGGGIVIDGRPYRGAHWGAGEVGHIRISMANERLCTCGLFDCWEAFGSGRGVIKTAQDLLEGFDEEQSPLAADPATLTTYRIFDAARGGDILAQKIVHRWHEHLTYGLITLSHTLNPSCFVLTGGLADSVDFELLEEMVVDHSLPHLGKNLEIRRSVLKGEAGIIGAAQFLLDELTLAAKKAD